MARERPSDRARASQRHGEAQADVGEGEARPVDGVDGGQHGSLWSVSGSTCIGKVEKAATPKRSCGRSTMNSAASRRAAADLEASPVRGLAAGKRVVHAARAIDQQHDVRAFADALDRLPERCTPPMPRMRPDDREHAGKAQPPVDGARHGIGLDAVERWDSPASSARAQKRQQRQRQQPEGPGFCERQVHAAPRSARPSAAGEGWKAPTAAAGDAGARHRWRRRPIASRQRSG